MRSRIFCKKFKSLVLVALAAFLILPSFLTIFKFTTPASAASCTDTSKAYCYVIKIYANEYASNVGHTATEVEHRTLTLSTDSNTFTYKNDVSQSVSGRTVNVSVNFQLDNGGNVVDSYSQSSGMFNLGPTRIEFYASDGTTLLQNETFQTTSGSTRSITVQGSTTGGGTQPTGQSTGDSTGEEANCHNSSGALGWVLCPILELAASASVWAYETVIEPSLQIRSSLFDATGTNNGTFQAWSVFRDFANVIFVILLLFVIFSQVTGIGIDNYGIKKTLPKLITAAILVNLSFYICQLLVDVSNIAGSGVYELINGINIDVTNASALSGIGYATSIIFTILASLGGLTIAGIVAGGAGALWTMISGALLAVVPVLIGALVSVLFLFFLLAMRQTIVVLLVALSPLAFVCYTLPNTKNLFDRWAQLLRGMLVLYPICAVMIAGGRLASKIILASGAAENNLFIILVAMVAEAGPLFLIPGLTRNAYRATGQLGASLNGLRMRMGGGARRAVAGNPAYRRAVERNRFTRISNRGNRITSQYDESAQNLANGSHRLRDRFRARQTAGNLERIAEARKLQVADEQHRQDLEKWTGTSTTDSTGREIRDVNGNLITQGQAIVNAQIANAQLNTEGEIARANLMNNQQYQDTRCSQTAKTIAEETTKMYADSYSRLSLPELQASFASAINAAPGTANQSEQIAAAIRTFSSIGQIDKMRDTLQSNAAGFNRYMDQSTENRNHAIQELGASGDWITREYSKHIADAQAKGLSTLNFNDWTNGTERDSSGALVKDRSLAASLNKRGVSALSDLDKDSIEYVGKSKQAMAGVSAEAVANAAATATNGEIITKLSQVINNLDATQRQQIVQTTSASQFVNMSDGLRIALAQDATGRRSPQGKVTQAFNVQINTLRQPENAQIAARLSSADRARYGV